MFLVSGRGVTSTKREGVFGAGRPITLGISAAEVDVLRAVSPQRPRSNIRSRADPAAAGSRFCGPIV
eukprot:7028202-Prymnesium_polylepis.1